jgi:TfdA family taurine catabolism dioxygenase TauD
MTDQPRVLEPHAAWLRDDLADPSLWTEQFTDEELRELERAMRHAQTVSNDLLQLSKQDFPLPAVAPRLQRIENELINGRGFALLRGLSRAQYNNDELCLLYWGIGLHLGNPWPQNQHGHMLGDVTDQGKKRDDYGVRGNELPGPLPYHSDGSDLVGLLCLQMAAEGGLSAICNALAIHNDMVRQHPQLAAELYQPQPNDFRGEQAPGKTSWYLMPIFTDFENRLFVRYIRTYIKASQLLPEAPRVSVRAEQAMQLLDRMTEDPKYHITMDLRPGDMQFINNYHVLHARTDYRDDRASGRVRHLKRLWLETTVLKQRPRYFARKDRDHWLTNKSISRLDRTG